MDDREEFKREVAGNVAAQGADPELAKVSLQWNQAIQKYKYSHSFTWLGMPIIQIPNDIVAMQELIWNTKPDLVIETGVARGGSVIFYASILELLQSNGHVLGVDIDVRPHNREAIENHPLSKRVTLIQGSSIAPETVSQVMGHAQKAKRIMVSLDSNHSHAHVLKELELYSPLVSIGCYCVVADTGVEFLPDDSRSTADRPWGKGNNPYTAVQAFLAKNNQFEIDSSIDNKLLISASKSGYLRRCR